MKNFTPRRQLPKLQLLNLLENLLQKKISNEDLNLCEAQTSLDEIMKSINSQTNNEFPINDGLKAVFYKHF